MKNLLFLLIAFCVFNSCKSDSCNDCNTDEIVTDTIPKKDSVKVEQKDTVGKITKTAESKDNHSKIVQKYGEQWDFCTCVIANDSINTAFEKGGMSPAQEEKLMARWEYVDNKCKELLTTPNTTPEERARHDKKVKKCLRMNKRR
jgi:hypothetical protein